MSILCKVAAASVLSLLAVVPASAKSVKDQLVGSWSLVSNVEEYADGKTVSWDQGSKGNLWFDSKGHFILMIAQVAPRKKVEGNPASFPVGQMMSYYGTYAVNEKAKTITYKIDTASSPSWDGTEQTRQLSKISATEFVYKAMAPIPSAQGTFVPVLTWKKVP